VRRPADPNVLRAAKFPQKRLPDRSHGLSRHETNLRFLRFSQGSRPQYRAAAEEMAAELVRRNIGLVYGGANVGLMGIIADAVLRAGGEA
jgi:predicted Rossmann-fold nucleotide-binding protein